MPKPCFEMAHQRYLLLEANSNVSPHESGTCNKEWLWDALSDPLHKAFLAQLFQRGAELGAKALSRFLHLFSGDREGGTPLSPGVGGRRHMDHSLRQRGKLHFGHSCRVEQLVQQLWLASAVQLTKPQRRNEVHPSNGSIYVVLRRSKRAADEHFRLGSGDSKNFNPAGMHPQCNLKAASFRQHLQRSIHAIFLC